MNGISAANGVLALDDISPDQVSLAMTPDRLPKGFWSGLVMSHIESGEAYYNVSANPMIVAKDLEATSIVASLKNNIKTLDKKATKLGVAFPTCNIARIGDNVVLVNVAAHLAKAAAEKAEADSNNDES